MTLEFSPLSSWFHNLKKPLVIAGPCSAETPEQIHQVAKELSKLDQVKALRAGVWKPRTRPNNFEGVGHVALPWLQDAKKEFNIPICIEVATPDHIELALKHDIDILWIGARTSANPFSVQLLADALKGVDIPVLVKNPINADLALWIGALERFSQAGIKKIGAIHRGFSRFEQSQYRNPPMWQIPIELRRRFPDLPLLCDPSHIAGKRENIGRVCQKAMDLSMDGMIIETHPTPQKAWSDAAQQVTPEALKQILESLSLRDHASTNNHFELEIQNLRQNIDRLDRDLIDTLSTRKQIVEKIAKAKYENNVTPLQVERMDQIIRERKKWAQEQGLGEKFARTLFDVIHEESVRTQTDIMNSFKSLGDDKEDNDQNKNENKNS